MADDNIIENIQYKMSFDLSELNASLNKAVAQLQQTSDAITASITDTAQQIEETAAEIEETISGITEEITEIVKKAVDQMAQATEEWQDKLESTFQEMLAKVKDLTGQWQTKWNDMVSELQLIYDQGMQSIENATEEWKNKLAATVQDVQAKVKALTEQWQTDWDQMVGQFETIYDQGMQSVENATQEWQSKLAATVQDVLAKFKNLTGQGQISWKEMASQFKETYKQGMQAVENATDEWQGKLAATVQDVLAKFKNLTGQGQTSWKEMAGQFQEIFKQGMQAVENATEGWKGKLGATVQDVLAKIKGLGGQWLPYWSGMIENMKGLFGNGMGAITANISSWKSVAGNLLQNVFENFKNSGGNVNTYWAGMVGNMKNIFSQGIEGMVSGTLSWDKAVHSTGQNVLKSFTGVTKQWVGNWLGANTANLAASKTTNAAVLASTLATETGKRSIFDITSIVQRTAAATGAGAASAAGSSAAMSSVSASAGAMTGVLGMIESVAQAIAAIPVSGWVMAGLMLAGLAMAWSSLSSAQSKASSDISSSAASFDVGTWSVPTDMLANIHKGEVIVPEPFSDKARNLLSGEAGAGNNMSVNVNYAVTTMDSKGVSDVLREHGNVIGDVIKRQVRDFKMTKAW